jgi:uncharacterized membrane protein
MRKVLISGLFASFLIGIIYFFLRYLVVDILDPLFKPLISRVTSNEILEILLDLVLAVIAIFIIGQITTRIKFQDIYNKYFRRVPINLEKGRGALVSISPGAYFLAIIIKEITIKKTSGELISYYVLYAPSTPIPMSGLPVIYVEKSKVMPVQLSYGEIYSIFGSFGASSPVSISELKTDASRKFPEDIEPEKPTNYD